MEYAKELLALFEDTNCDHGKCHELIKKIGGCTQIIEGKYGVSTTPLHEAIYYGLYDLALELIGEPEADLNVDPDGCGPIMWELQYLEAEDEGERRVESKNKLRLVRALINAGADPNPKESGNGEELLYYIRFQLNEGDGNYHLWQMEHIIEAHAYGETQRFFKKLKERAVTSVMLSKWGFYLIDDDLCDCDYAIFVFDDGERMALSSYQVDDDEWDFYAVPIRKDLLLEPEYYYNILPRNDLIKFASLYKEEHPTLHWLELYVDDALLQIHADSPNISVGIVNSAKKARRKRKKLF